MTPKEKAKELVEKMMYCGNSQTVLFLQESKRCALVAVDEILNIFKSEWIELDFWTNELDSTIDYWQQVRKEIELL